MSKNVKDKKSGSCRESYDRYYKKFEVDKGVITPGKDLKVKEDACCNEYKHRYKGPLL